MEEEKRSSLLIAGTASGSGKTSVMCGLLRAFQKRGKHPAACKCGPDYIDPMFHENVLGIPSQNLDLFFCNREQLKRLYARHSMGRDLTIIEGVMGYYDGMSMEQTKGSSFEIAQTLGIPVVLVIPCRGMGHSVLALLKGYLEYKKDSGIRAVIFNGISGPAYEKLKPVVEDWLKIHHPSVKVAGYLPQIKDATLKSRHLGLVLPGELEELEKRINLLADEVEKCIDLDLLEQIAKEAGTAEKEKEESITKKKARVAVAKDEAFCFYYKENLELLERNGCELISFSPLHDKSFPSDIDGLILAGGYPELYAKELSENRMMKEEILERLQKGLPCLAECGGFLYLKEELEGEDETFYPMVGFLEGKAYKTGKLGRFGYITLQSKEDTMWLKKGETIRGHEFHYWDCTNNGDKCIAMKPDGKRKWEGMQEKGHTFAGFPHISYVSNPEVVKRFVGLCMEGRRK